MEQMVTAEQIMGLGEHEAGSKAGRFGAQPRRIEGDAKGSAYANAEHPPRGRNPGGRFWSRLGRMPAGR
jgi:hypothetical protein